MSVSRALRVFSTRDLVIIAVLAALGIAVKPVVVPLAHLVSAPLFIPGGALAGGIYMMWLVVGMGITGKRGTATLIALVQALLVMLTGVVGSHGALSLISYTAPGIVMDLGLWLTRHRACCLRCCFLAGILANVTGTLMVSFIFFRLPPIPLALALCTAALSGGVGGVLAWQVIKALRRHHIGVAMAGRATTGVLLLALAALTAAATLGATACSSGEESPASAAPEASATAVAAQAGHDIPVVWAQTNQNGSLSLDEAFAGAGEDVLPLAEALAAQAPAPPQRVAVYLADGSLLRLATAGCSLTSSGGLVAGGADHGAVTGIVADPPPATITDVYALARENLAAGGRTLVVYLDGFGYDQFVAANKAGTIPVLSGLKARRALTVYPTITPVTFAAMVSGEDPATTGVHDRSRHRLDCESIYDWAERRGLSTSLIEGNLQILALTANTTLTVDDDGDGLTDDEAFAEAEERLAAGQPDFMLVHLHGIDDTSHEHGPFAAETRREVAAQDAVVGRLLRLWKGQVIVVADHGQHPATDESGERRGEHGEFRAEDLFIPLLVRPAGE